MLLRAVHLLFFAALFVGYATGFSIDLPSSLKELFDKQNPSKAFVEAKKRLDTAFQGVLDAEKQIERAFQNSDLTFEEITEKLSSKIAGAVSSESHTWLTTRDEEKDDVQRPSLESVIGKTLDVIETALVEIARSFDADTAHIHQAFKDARQPITEGFVVVAKVVEDNPCLFEVLAGIAVMIAELPIPGNWIVRPFLALLGFSRKGPLKGSFAAQMQSKVYKGEVPFGSIFSKLQKGAMKSIPFAGALLEGIAISSGIASLISSCIPHLKF